MAECVAVAHLVRPVLDGMGLVSVPVTSGSKGLHIYAGLDGSATSEQVAEVAHELDDPDLAQLTYTEVLTRMRSVEDPLAVLTPRARGAGVEAAGPAPDRLATYRSMRDPRRTPEPVPDEAPTPRDGRSFVVHEHHARRFHHDLRLERGGVLVSWAVPKGVPAGAAPNRLAVQTEDHPLEYGSFEGTIPTGEYGAGTVTIWDAGEYEPESWQDDKIVVTLHGRGGGGLGGHPRRFALIRTGSGDDAGRWLLHVHRDQPDPVGGADTAAPTLRGGNPLPSPMLATPGTVSDVDDGRWVAEAKWDGFRAIAAVLGEEVVRLRGTLHKCSKSCARTMRAFRLTIPQRTPSMKTKVGSRRGLRGSGPARTRPLQVDPG